MNNTEDLQGPNSDREYQDIEEKNTLQQVTEQMDNIDQSIEVLEQNKA